MLTGSAGDQAKCGTGFQPVRRYTWGLDLAGLNGTISNPMKGCLLPGGYAARCGVLRQETAMGMNESVARIGMDIHRKFSKVTARDAQQRIVWRERLEHRERDVLRQRAGRVKGATCSYSIICGCRSHV